MLYAVSSQLDPMLWGDTTSPPLAFLHGPKFRVPNIGTILRFHEANFSRTAGTWEHGGGTLFAFSLRIAMPFWLVHVYGHWWLADVLFFFQNVPKDITPICIDLNKNAKKIIICSKNIYRPCIYMLICNANVQSMRLDAYCSLYLWISRFLELF